MSTTSFISTTIPYVNANPHLGHALEYVQADAYARHFTREGRDVFLLSGSDENSLKNVLAAEQLGLSTSELVARNVTSFEQLMKALDVHVQRFIRTSVDADHIAGATEMWRRMEAAGDIYTKEYEGLYCVGCEQFYAETELVNDACPDHLTKPDLVHERNYFFRLSRYQEQIMEALGRNTIRITPHSRLNEIMGFLRGGLDDISISRSAGRARGWGIPVPGDPEQVMYVWIDALTNYVNALGWPNEDRGYARYWTDAERRVHVLGKGVIRFHAVYWPAMLMSAGLPVPTDVVVHGYITMAGQKLSKSLGNVVDPAALVDKYGASALRYFLLAECPPFGDSDFSEERLIERYNTDLANGLGNLVNRVTSMIGRYHGGIVPPAHSLAAADDALGQQVLTSWTQSVDAMNRFDHRESLARVWDLVRRTNAYIDERAPWHLAKAAGAGDTDSATALETTLHHVAGAVRQLGLLTAPFLPEPAEKILAAFGAAVGTTPRAAHWRERLTGRPVTKPATLFPRLES